MNPHAFAVSHDVASGEIDRDIASGYHDDSLPRVGQAIIRFLECHGVSNSYSRLDTDGGMCGGKACCEDCHADKTGIERGFHF